jgi:hypothetical protein
LQVREAFQKAKKDVYLASGRAQNPSIYEDIVGAYYSVSPPALNAGRTDLAAEAWAVIKTSTDPADFENFAHAFATSDLV